MSTLSAPQLPAAGVSRRREEIAWAMYDWASSAWSTIQITVAVGYLQQIVFNDKEFGPTTGAVVYAYSIGISMFIAALASPVIGALADARANKRYWLIGATCLGACSAFLMGVVPPSSVYVVAALFFLTNLGFELCWGIYNGFLPEIADDQSMNRVSAWGFAFGYVGGGLMLLISLLIYNFGESLGLVEVSSRLRVSISLMGLWWLGFSLPAFLVLKDRGQAASEPRSAWEEAQAAFRQVGQTLLNIRRYGALSLFLIGFLFYNDGMQTVISQASVFAESVLKMNVGELSAMILMVQFVSLPGALIVGKLSDWIGAKTMLHMMLAIWVGLLVAGFFVNTKFQFWIMAAVLALVMGGGQSVSRAIMGFMTPEKHAAQFMGFFNLSGRAASMLGPILFGTIFGLTGSAHWAILSLLVFFVIGWLLVAPVDIEKGRRQAEKAA